MPCCHVTAEECKLRCDDTPSCIGFTIERATPPSTVSACYRRSQVDISRCVTGKPFDTWVRTSVQLPWGPPLPPVEPSSPLAPAPSIPVPPATPSPTPASPTNPAPTMLPPHMQQPVIPPPSVAHSPPPSPPPAPPLPIPPTPPPPFTPSSLRLVLTNGSSRSDYWLAASLVAVCIAGMFSLIVRCYGRSRHSSRKKMQRIACDEARAEDSTTATAATMEAPQEQGIDLQYQPENDHEETEMHEIQASFNVRASIRKDGRVLLD